MTNARLLITAIDIPNPIDVVTRVVSAPAGWAWNQVADGITRWILGAVAYFVDGVINFLLTAARPDVSSAWFSGASSPYATVRGIAIALLLAFVFLGIIQGLIAGDPGAMLRRLTADLPAAVFGMVTTTIVVAKLLELTDALSAMVLSNSHGQSLHFLTGFGVSVTGSTQGFAAVIVGLVAVLAGLFVWVELMVRSVLVYILVALSPLSFAAMVWPAARDVLRRTIELLVAVILSKFVICVAVSVGVAALAGAGASPSPAAAGASRPAAASMGTLLVGTAILAIAAFAPFLVLKLIPWAESALVAQGVSRGPVRGAQSTMSSVYYANSLTRLAGGSRSGGGASATSGWSVGAPAMSAGTNAAAGIGGGPAAVVTAGTAAASRVSSTATRSVETATGTGTGRGSGTDANAPDRAPASRRRPDSRPADAPRRDEKR